MLGYLRHHGAGLGYLVDQAVGPVYVLAVAARYYNFHFDTFAALL